jgi:methylmalonyl-CoA mutase
VIPPHRTRYLSEIAESNRKYDVDCRKPRSCSKNYHGIYKTIETVANKTPELNKAGINDDSVLPTAVELEKLGLPTIKYF